MSGRGMKISVIMATYNGHQYLPEQLESIKNQCVQPDEVIIRDDCSSDNTQEIVSDYIRNNRLTSWSFEKNEHNVGYKINFSTLLHEAKGEIIFLCDQDDVWKDDKVQLMVETMNNNPSVLLLASDLEPIYMTENAPKVNYEKFTKKVNKIGFSGKWIKPVRPGCTFAIRRNLVPYYDAFWDPNISHDCALWNIACLLDAACYLNESLMYYRRFDQNASNLGDHSIAYRLKAIQDEINIIDKAINLPLVDNKKQFLENQKRVYLKRIDILKEKKLLSALLFGINNQQYYGRKRYILTDAYYCIKGK